jgi:hypothetical protein
MTRNGLTLVVLAFATAFAPPASAQQAAGTFAKGRTHFVVTGGTGYAFDESYFVLGVGASYHLVDGLSAGLHVETWSGGDPDMYKLTGSLQYVFYPVPRLKPYVGAFYRRTDVDGLPDIDSAGGRAGAFLEAGRNAYIGLGIVYESYLDCSQTVYRSCDSTYAEVTFTVAF